MVKYFWIFWVRKDALIKNYEKKINKLRILDAKKINNNFISKLDQIECLIIDNFNYNIEENCFIQY